MPATDFDIRTAGDLVPVEQWELVQDVLGRADFERLATTDARACVSVCRPVGHMYDAHQRTPGGQPKPTMWHQTGDLVLQPMSLAHDVHRGMFSTCVASEAFTAQFCHLKEVEKEVVPRLLDWLGWPGEGHNPWICAYKASAWDMRDKLQELSAVFQSEGRVFPGGMENVTTKDGRRLADALDAEQIVLLQPDDDLAAFEGSYNALRATADTVATSSLRQSLPTAWQRLKHNPIKDAAGEPLRTLPEFLDLNTSFTNVSFKDKHLEAKTFVRQFRYGTGSFLSTADCVTARLAYRRARFWSLDGEFLDDVDPMWIFWQYEFDKKMSLHQDWEGKRKRPVDAHHLSATPAKAPRLNRLSLYSKYTFSPRIGRNIKDSPQALGANRHEFLHLARPENLGSPPGMTTVVINLHAPAVTAHVQRGPLAKPNSEDALDILREDNVKNARVKATAHAGVRAAHYLVARSHFEHIAFRPRSAIDTFHGRPVAYTRRREGQKRGDNHDHYVYWCESCGDLFAARARVRDQPPPVASTTAASSQPVATDLAEESPPQPAATDQAPPNVPDEMRVELPLSQTAEAPALERAEPHASTPASTHEASCWHPSRFCTRAHRHCRLPGPVQAAAFHQKCHHAYTRTELVRPFPLGASPRCHPPAPNLRGLDLAGCRRALAQDLYTSKPPLLQPTLPLPPLCERMHAELLTVQTNRKLCHGHRMTLDDLIVCFYYRSLQTIFIHNCILGDCRKSMVHPCKRNLPVTKETWAMEYNEETERQDCLRRYLPDDAWLASHILELTVATLSNIQTNVHHPDDPNGQQGYHLKYITKRETQVAMSKESAFDEPVVEYFKCQVVSLAGAAAAVLGDPITATTRRAPLVFPSFDIHAGSTNWKHYVCRYTCYDSRQLQLTTRPSAEKHVVDEDAFRASLCLARANQLLRYFAAVTDERNRDNGDGDDDQNPAPDIPDHNQEPDDLAGSKSAVDRLTAQTWDSHQDNPRHPDYDVIFSRLLPGEFLDFRFHDKNIRYRRLRNGDFTFPRYIWPDLSLKKDPQGRTQRSKHFQTRLLAHLNWHMHADPQQRVLLTILPSYVVHGKNPQFHWWRLDRSTATGDEDGTLTYAIPQLQAEDSDPGGAYEAACVELEVLFVPTMQRVSVLCPAAAGALRPLHGGRRMAPL